MPPHPEPIAGASTQRPVHDAALARVRRRLATAGAAGEPPWLHTEVARRMAERLALIRQQPRTLLDWDAAAGGSAEALRSACPKTQRLPIQRGNTTAPAAPSWWSPRRWRSEPPPRSADTLPAAAGDLLWSNMGLHWCADPVAEMRRWHAALAVDGFLMFSTVGPGTLASLRDLYARLGWPTPHAPFVDMHDLGDMLVRAGFADPVMDQETLTLSWADGDAALRELRTLGGNADPHRHPGLRTPRWRALLAQALLPGDGQRPALEVEVVYGHAFRPAPRVRVATETTVGLQDMRSILKRQT